MIVLKRSGFFYFCGLSFFALARSSFPKRLECVTLALAVCMLAAASVAGAQNIPPVSNPACVDVPGIPCSRSSTPSSNSHSMGLSTNQMMQQEIVTTVVGSFLNMLFSDESQANAQKQKMLAELEARQAEAVKQQQEEEAMRLAQICKQLQGTLKLSGTPELQLKTVVAGGSDMQLKMSDESDTQNCENKYLNGVSFYALPAEKLRSMGMKPCAHKQERVGRDGGLGLKMGDGLEGVARPAVGGADPRTMTAQQLADLAQNLTPEQQETLAKALQAGQPGSSATTAIDSQASQTPGMGTAFGQLQQMPSTVTAGSPEAMASQARVGFDMAGTGGVTAPGSGGGSGVVDLRTVDPNNPATVAQLPQPAGGTQSVGSTSAVVGTQLHADSSGISNIATGEAILNAAPVVPKSRIPQMSDEELRKETCRTRAMLSEIGRDAIKGTQEMNALTKEVEETRKEAVAAGIKCFSEMLEKYVDTKMEAAYVGKSAGEEKEAREHLVKVWNLGRDIEVTSIDYNFSAQQREQKLESALGYLSSVYDYMQKVEGVPWVSTAKCMIDFGYVAGKVYVEQEQIDTMNSNLGNSAGALKAESAVAGFYKKLADESLRRGMNPKTYCEQ